MRRLKDERGAVGVLVALLMVPLLGLAAIGVDVAALWADRQQLQAGADAAALAIAQDCARSVCGTAGSTAQSLAVANANDAVTAEVLTSPLSTSSREVTVRTTGTRQHVFAPVIGTDSTTVSTEATARWGAPSGGITKLPLIFSWCEFAKQTGGGLPSSTTEWVIKLSKTSGVDGCTGPSRNAVPGGFGWLTPDSGTCEITTAVNGVVYTEPGNSVPSGCSPSDFAGFQGKTVLLPIFDDAGGTGSGAWYHVYGYAAFKVTGYNFTTQYVTQPAPCSGNDRCIKGYFLKFVYLNEAFSYSATAPQLGASVISLTR